MLSASVSEEWEEGGRGVWALAVWVMVVVMAALVVVVVSVGVAEQEEEEESGWGDGREGRRLAHTVQYLATWRNSARNTHWTMRTGTARDKKRKQK